MDPSQRIKRSFGKTFVYNINCTKNLRKNQQPRRKRALGYGTRLLIKIYGIIYPNNSNHALVPIILVIPFLVKFSIFLILI
jgi:hypothetical protein